jgi:hypothetical protein
MRPPRVASALLLAATATACLDPLVGDEPGPRAGLILPAGTEVPSVHDDRELERQIGLNDGVYGTVPRIHGFAEDAEVYYWDFGAAPTFAAPLFRLVRRTGEGAFEPVDHPTIIEAIPGQPGYSPFWAVLDVPVTDVYAGELLTAFEAVQEAQQRGLVEAPIQPTAGVNCPVVAGGVTLQVGPDAARPPDGRAFWRGVIVDYFDFGGMPLLEKAVAPARPRYTLHRAGGEPISEPLRGIDLTEDGDLDDTNDVLTGRPGEKEDYSPLCETVEVALDPATPLIDDTAPVASTIRKAKDLVDGSVPTAVVQGMRSTGELRNCPQQRQAGSL